MKRITLLGIISLLFIFACYEDNHPTNNTENENVQIEKFVKEIEEMRLYIGTLSISELQVLHQECLNYLNASESKKEEMYADIQQILHLNSNLSIEIKTENVRNKAYQELNKFLFPNIEEITTKGSENCASVRDRKLNSLANKYAIEFTGACLAGPLTGGIGTAISIAVITAVTEIERREIWAEYDDCVKKS